MNSIDTPQPCREQGSQTGEVAELSWWIRRRSTILLLASLLWTTLVATRGITKGEFSFINDEALHAVTGLYFADFLHDLPLRHPLEYTFRFEAQYPALGLLHWPPVFHFAEGVMFLLLGREVVVARLTILIFALFGFYFWFKLVNELQDAWTAAASTIVLASHPALLIYEKAVMLEIPSLALCVAASYFWMRFLKRGRDLDFGWFALFGAAGVLAKYQAIYLAVFCLLTIAVERKWRRLLNKTVLVAAVASALVFVPYLMIVVKLHGRWMTGLALKTVVPQPGGAKTFTKLYHAFPYYWTRLPGNDQLGWPLLALSVVGLLTSRWWAKKDGALTMLIWVAACYLTMTVLSTREPRYIIFWLPAWVYFALGPLTVRSANWRSTSVRACVAVVVVSVYAWLGWTHRRPYVSGYEAAAQRVIQRDGSPLVLFDGDLPGNFIFFMRSHDPAHRFFILRKALYDREAGVALIKSRAELDDFIQKYAIRTVVISENKKIRFDAQRYLREALQSSEFRLVEEFPVESTDPSWPSHYLLLYERTSVNPRTETNLKLKMPELSHDITVPLDDSVHP
jgi:hypothetical protein